LHYINTGWLVAWHSW